MTAGIDWHPVFLEPGALNPLSEFEKSECNPSRDNFSKSARRAAPRHGSRQFKRNIGNVVHSVHCGHQNRQKQAQTLHHQPNHSNNAKDAEGFEPYHSHTLALL